MDNINKIISFALGLIVVAIFLVIISGRLQIGKKLFTASRGATTTSVSPFDTDTVTETVSPASKPVAENTTVTPTKKVPAVNHIPDTGMSSTAILYLGIAILAGVSLWKMSEV